jgi:hypothetical protein
MAALRGSNLVPPGGSSTLDTEGLPLVITKYDAPPGS